jgi:hypothetical protein
MKAGKEFRSCFPAFQIHLRCLGNADRNTADRKSRLTENRPGARQPGSLFSARHFSAILFE